MNWALGRRLFSAATTTAVRRGHEIDVSKVLPLLVNCGAIQAEDAAPGSVKVEQFAHGQSNPTYKLQFGNGKQLVLRKQPPGKLLRGIPSHLNPR